MIPITEAVQTTIKLGDTDLEVFQLRDGSYASPGLFRLMDTDIYQYQEAWYWLGRELPSLKECKVWDSNKESFLAFERNRLSYLYITLVDPEKAFRADNVSYSYVPVPSYIESVIDFCTLGEILPDNAIDQLCYMVDEHLHSSSRLTRLSAQSFLLRDTLQYLRLSGKMDQVQ
jgi:hypothetical protein